MNEDTQPITLQVQAQDVEGASPRLDAWLANQLPDVSRSRLKQLAKEGCVMLDGQVLRSLSGKVKEGMRFDVAVPATTVSELVPWNVPLDIVYEDEHLLVINKAVGMTVHPAAGHEQDTLVNALLAHCPDTLSGIGGVERPGIVHRLDKDTSGLMVVAKHDVAHRHLSDQLKDRSLSRTYHALCWGVPIPMEGKINAPIARHPKDRKKMAIVKDGREAVTYYRAERRWSDLSIIRCKLETGRTHQIRVHLANIRCPLIGDEVYGARAQRRVKELEPEVQEAIAKLQGQALHASAIGFIHPHSNEYMEFEYPMEPVMAEIIERLS